MWLFDSFGGKKPQTPLQDTDNETLIIPDTIEDLPMQPLENVAENPLDNYTISNEGLEWTPIVEPMTADTLGNADDILIQDTPLVAETNLNGNIDLTAQMPSNETPLVSEMPAEPQKIELAETPEITPMPEVSLDESALFGAATTTATVKAVSSLSVDDAVSDFEKNLDAIKKDISEQKTKNLDAIKQTEETLKKLKKEKTEIEARESRLEEIKANILNTKTKPASRRRSTRTKKTA